jgi:hypothetical protein
MAVRDPVAEIEGVLCGGFFRRVLPVVVQQRAPSSMGRQSPFGQLAGRQFWR